MTKACFTGCSTCTSAAANSCSVCISGYVLAGSYCCQSATPFLQGTTCQAGCNTGFFSLNSVCTGIYKIIKF